MLGPFDCTPEETWPQRGLVRVIVEGGIFSVKSLPLCHLLFVLLTLSKLQFPDGDDIYPIGYF